MAFGMFSPDPNDSYDTGRTVGLDARKRAQDFLNKYIETDIVGGAGVDTFGQMRYKEILGDAQQSANQTAQGAKTFGDIANFAGSMGTIGASKGGFSGFSDQWKGWGNGGSTGDNFAGVPNSVLDSVLQ